MQTASFCAQQLRDLTESFGAGCATSDYNVNAWRAGPAWRIANGRLSFSRVADEFVFAGAGNMKQGRFVIGAFLVFFLAAVNAQQAPAKNEKFVAAEQAMKAKKYEEAQRGYEQANKALGGHCMECFLNSAQAALMLGKHDDAVKLSGKAVEAAATPDEKFAALVGRVKLLIQVLPVKKDLPIEEESASKALELRPDDLTAHYLHGLVLLRAEKDEAGVAELRGVESRLTDGPDKKLVQSFISNPRRARMQIAPEFQAKTSTGSIVTLADLKGKVVLLDFWATWCPPCRESVPEIKELRKKYGDRLAVLSVSADDDRDKWSQYISKHEMTWLQSWDKDNDPSVLKAFGVHSFPTYVLLDGDGVVRERVNGLEEHQTLTRRLHDALEKSLK
jgi:thiol-disulfide isomerase/thioredoxin